MFTNVPCKQTMKAKLLLSFNFGDIYTVIFCHYLIQKKMSIEIS